ncbi:PhzF family phenazine biosynthesis protein [Paenibacillus sediminis]|uniref:PhzF family phenazine biosynthesis protein n=1 Tax=Paenibacillus sediminis TaxID=664909 RepID=A0ABS4H201_9BACL|nr:PhzF family phenazine biosynthesis protein [Paenibacillus sediminis]
MKKVEVLHYDAFSSIPNQGNRAGVVLKGNELSLGDMQEIAAKVGFNERFPSLLAENTKSSK